MQIFIYVNFNGKRARSESYELFIFRITAPVIRYALFSYCFGNYLSSFIIAACRANPMRHHRFVALRAGYEAWRFQLPICAALIATGFGHFALWYCHFIFTSGVIRIPVSEIHAMG